VTPPSGADFARLSALIARQRHELDGLQSAAAARSVVDLARGMLMERLGCSPADAQEQLEHLSAESGTSLAELAANITGQPSPARASNGHRAAAGDGPADAVAGPAGAVPAVNGGPAGMLAAAAMETAADGAGLATALLEEALADAGAAAVAVWLAEPDGGLELAGQAGFAARDASRWRRIHPDLRTPALWAADDGTGTWWPAGPPGGPDTGTPLLGDWPRGARAVLPLPGPGAPIGALEICWPGPLSEFSRPLRRQLSALAEVCAQAVGTRLRTGGLAADQRASWAFSLLDGLLGSAMYAKAVRAGGQVTDFLISYLSEGFRDPAGRPAADIAGRPLLEMYPGAALASGLFDQAVRVLATGRAGRVSGAVFSTPVGDSTLTPMLEVRISRLYDGVVIAWRRADEVERLGGLLHQAQRLGRIGGWEENLLTGDVLWTEPTYALFGRRPDDPVPIGQLTAHVPADDRHAVETFRSTLLQDRREAAAVFRVIRAEDESVRQIRAFAEPIMDQAGTLIAVRGAYQDVSADYHTQVAFAATRDRLADSEERAAEEHRLAVRLQQAITPQAAAPAEIPGLDVAARYRPAGPGNLVSGDWYDTVQLPGGDVLLVVGDIAGHGIDAVTGMVALRNCLRGLAITGAGPAALLGWLNGVACQLTDGIIGTVVCGVFRPADRTLRWARAGHLPPLLVRAGVASELQLPIGVLVGADPASRYHEVTTELVPGDALLLYTDGLVERRHEAIDDSLHTLCRLASQPVEDIGRFADHLLTSSHADTSDDACLVAVLVR
jgi:serine phosphatase RsbU (regulator of sigma subunit)/PAS domain-containing protein